MIKPDKSEWKIIIDGELIEIEGIDLSIKYNIIEMKTTYIINITKKKTTKEDKK